MTLSSKIATIEKCIGDKVQNGMPMRRAIEEELQATSQDLSPIYTLKYYLGQTNDENTDEAMQFLNGLMSLFGKSVDSIDSIKTFKDLENDDSPQTRELNLRDHLRRNGGIESSAYSCAYYDNGNLIVGRKEAKLNKDGSVGMAVKTDITMRSFYTTLTTEYAYLYGKERVKEIKEMFDVIIDNQHFATSDNIILVIANKSALTGVIKYTIFNKEYKSQQEEDVLFCEQIELEYEGCEFEVWVI